MTQPHLDVHLTPDALALAICQHLKRNFPVISSILEPSAGEGAFVRAAHATWPKACIAAVECRAECAKPLRASGACAVYTQSITQFLNDPLLARPFLFDLVLGNPPFYHAEEHIRLLLERMKSGSYLAFLLRINFYGSKKRLPFWQEFPEHIMFPIVPRPGFSGSDGTDMTEYGLFVWYRGNAGPSQRGSHITWSKK